jgi:hypothetical protein
MHRHGLSLAPALLLGVLSAGCNDATEGQEHFQAVLSGGNEVPPRSTGATGVCSFVAAGDRVNFVIETHDLSAPVVGAHIHLGVAGVNGPVRVGFISPNLAGTSIATPFDAPDGILMENTFSGSDVSGGLTLDDILNAMRTGGAYCNIHTSNFPGGEIRGQIAPINLD